MFLGYMCELCNKTFDGTVHKVMRIFSVTVIVTPG